MPEKKVSIIVPIYNVLHYLNQAIESACNQTYDNIEILLVDDGATDGCAELCDSWAEQDSRIKVIHKRNGGLSDARNAGLDAATGDYIYFMDGDDYISPDLVKTAVQFMDTGISMVVFQHYVFKEKDKAEVSDRIPGEYTLDGIEAKKEFYIKTLLRYRIGWEAWNRMFRRDVIERLHLRFADNKIIFAEDLYFNICYCFGAEQIKSVEIPLYYYRLREDSIMRKQSVKLNANRMNELSKTVLQFFKLHDALNELMEVFPIIHFQLTENCAAIFKRTHHINEIQLRAYLLDDIEDKQYFFSMLKALEDRKSLLKKYFGKYDVMNILKLARYRRTGNLIDYIIRAVNCKLYKLTVRLWK